MKRKVSVILTLIMLLSTFCIPVSVDASTKYKTVNLCENKVSVGVVKFSSKRDEASGKVTIYYKSGKKTKVLASAKGLNYDIVTNGRYAYYIVSVNDTTCHFYKKDLKTGSKRKVFTEKKTDMLISLSGLYQNRLYYVNGIDPGTLYCYDLKSGKKTKVMDNVTTAVQYGNTFMCTPYEGDVGPSTLRVYDAKHNKKKTITKNKMAYRVIGNQLYYVAYVKASDSGSGAYICNVIRCGLDGKNKKVLLKNRKINGYISKITSSYIQYTYYDYKNDISTVFTLRYK